MNFVRRSLILIGTPVAVLFIITTLLAASLVSRTTGRQTASFMKAQTEKCVMDIENVLIAPMKMTEAICWVFDGGFYASNREVNEVFVKMSGAYPTFSGFYGCRTDKTMFSTPSLILPDDYDPTSRNWYKGAVEKMGKMYYSDVYVDAFTGDLVVTFSQAVYRRDKLDGVVAFDYPLTSLLELLGDLKTSETDQSFILSPTGDFFMHEHYMPDENILTVEDGLYEKLGANLLASSTIDEGNFVKGKMNGKNYVFIVSRMPTTGWLYVLGKEAKEVNSSSRMISGLLVVLFIILFAFIMVITAVIMKKMREKEGRASENLTSETQRLVVSSKENASSAQDQSASVKEIVATMEDNTALSENISTKIKDVAAVAGKTSNDVAEGVKHLEENVRQLHEIADANQHTIDGIKNLSEKIDNIWDIVTLINSVADQSKIIAFNAELEASSAGESGKNFHIVATEIRRLADGIIDGTKEIKGRIDEIQQSSDSLILASESGTEKINEGCESAKNLEERFASIKNASEITADSAGDITKIIQQQVAASEQILITLKQVSSGIEAFGSMTESISAASEKLQVIAEELVT